MTASKCYLRSHLVSTLIRICIAVRRSSWLGQQISPHPLILAHTEHRVHGQIISEGTL
jgi:hypothetical protein